MPSRPFILAIDTAMSRSAVCLFNHETGAEFQKVLDSLHGHAGTLVPMIEEILRDAETDYGSVGLIAVTTGPGSFTGIRVGLSCARSLALALDIPVRGFNTLEILAHQFLKTTQPSEFDSKNKNPVCLVETRRNNLFMQSFSPDAQPIGAPQDIAPQDIILPGDSILLGDGVQRFLSQVPDASFCHAPDSVRHIDPVFLARYAWGQESAGQPSCPVMPFYLRPADVSGNPIRSTSS